MKLIIAEKPELGRSIARAIAGAPDNARLPYEGQGWCVVSCIGHLLGLAEPSVVDPERYGDRYNLDSLPILLNPWPMVPKKGTEEALAEIGRQLKRCDSVVHAGDPDDEGQLLVDEVLDYFGYDGPVQRVYINDNLDKNIRKAFANLRGNETCRPAGRASLARKIADFCFGINESRLILAKTGGAAVSVGRVQTPTLGLVVRRDEEIMGHVATTYLVPTVMLEVAGEPVRFTFKPDRELLDEETGKLLDRGAAERAIGAMRNSGPGTLVCQVESREYHAPLPYNLTDLTADMSKRYKMSAKQVLDATQSLRDVHRAITYNRSDCNYLPDAAHEEAPAVLSAAMGNVGAAWPVDASIKGRCFNDANITAHTAIIPQESRFDPGSLSKHERLVYEAVAERYAMQFTSPARGRVSVSRIKVENGAFEHRSAVIDDPAWKAIRDTGPAEKDADEGWIDAGEHRWGYIEGAVEEKKTKPRPRYTEGTLIKDMASIAKYVTDPEVKRVLKEKDEGKKGEHGGIGTSATRAKTIEILKARGYIEAAKGKLVSTNLGRAVYHACPADIANPDLTAKWYLMCEEVRSGEADVYSVAESVIESFEAHRDTAYEGIAAARGRVVGKCPVCGMDVVDPRPDAKAVSCSSRKGHREGDRYVVDDPGCGFRVFKTMYGKRLTDNQIESLVREGHTNFISGFKSKTGSPYTARLRLGADGRVEREFRPSGRGAKR